MQSLRQLPGSREAFLQTDVTQAMGTLYDFKFDLSAPANISTQPISKQQHGNKNMEWVENASYYDDDDILRVGETLPIHMHSSATFLLTNRCHERIGSNFATRTTLHVSIAIPRRIIQNKVHFSSITIEKGGCGTVPILSELMKKIPRQTPRKDAT
eukprot:gene6972-7618_t